jgi:glycogen debranching enzyme
VNTFEAEEDRFHVAATSLTVLGTRVLKHNDTFAVLNRLGDIEATGAGHQGIYHSGTKFVSRLRARMNGRPLLMLSSSMLESDVVLQVDLTNPDIPDKNDRLVVPYGSVHVSRSIFLRNDVWFQRFQLSNYGREPVALQLSIEIDSDFVDIFEVRGTRRARRGERLPSEVGTEYVVLGYRGLDGVERRTRYEFSPAPTTLGERGITFDLNLAAQQSKEIYVWVACLTEHEQAKLTAFETALTETVKASRSFIDGQCQIYSSNEQFNRWVNRSQSDLGMLLTETPHGPYPHAGVPWFSTPFGRDGIWTALQMLWIAPEIAAGVLRFLSATQAEWFDSELDAEPGKIVHEMREGEMAALREIPFGRYYGSVDSTPLYLMLAARYYRATADRALIASIWPSLSKAAQWVEEYGDVDGDGFVEYGRRSKDGLLQQGWKDSSDSVFHRDGTLATGPLALCEVQGYAYEARLGMAMLSQVMGEPERAARYERDAETLRTRFDDAFWCDELSTYALALDAKKLACRVRTSNAGHCLYTGIAYPARAQALTQTLFHETMFSGWGIRTLATDEERYNPMSYHNGSLWPHDNAIVAAGLAQYGFKREAQRVLTGMFEASSFAEFHRLPELFCGFTKNPGQGPTLYPVACSPQAWASGTVFMLLRAVLGLDISAIDQRVTFTHPTLPSFLERLELRNIRVGSACVDIALHRYPDDVVISVTRKTGTLEVLMVK